MPERASQNKSLKNKSQADERRQWFRLDQPISVRWMPLDSDCLPELSQLEQGLPQALQLGGEIRNQLSRLPSSQRKIWQLTEQKLDALLSLLLSQDQAQGEHGELIEISAGGGRLRVPAPFPAASHLQLLLLPPEPGHPMVVAAEVIRRTVPVTQDDNNQISSEAVLALHWVRIRHQDQETLARCTLAWQAARLRRQHV